MSAGLACGLAAAALVAMVVVDDAGESVALRTPARRIVSLSPHATEALFEAGAGERIVGTVEHADHPEAAKRLPRVGDSAMLDLERIAALEPDLLVVWHQGTSRRSLEALRRLGIPMFHTQPRRLADIPALLRRLGRLAGTEPRAEEAAARYAARLQALERTYAGRPPVRVFYQVWDQPLLTVNGTHIISDAIRACGGRNVFAGEALLVPTLDMEAVVRARPEAIVGSAPPPGSAGLMIWRKLPAFEPVARGHLATLPTDALGRASPRILDGVQLLCEALDGVRAKRR